MKYKGYDIVESTRHGKSVKGTKTRSSMQVRLDAGTDGGYFLVHNARFLVDGGLRARLDALDKAKAWIDKNPVSEQKKKYGWNT